MPPRWTYAPSRKIRKSGGVSPTASIAVTDLAGGDVLVAQGGQEAPASREERGPRRIVHAVVERCAVGEPLGVGAEVRDAVDVHAQVHARAAGPCLVALHVGTARGDRIDRMRDGATELGSDEVVVAAAVHALA